MSNVPGNDPLMRIGRATTSDGYRIHFASESGTGTPLVYLDPLFSLHVDQQLRFESDLAYMRAIAAGASWYIFDWRGGGGSSPIQAQLTFDNLVDDLESVVLATGVPCDIAAWITGQVAVAFAQRRPDLVRRLFLLDPLLSGDDDLGYDVIRDGWLSDPVGAMVVHLMITENSLSMARANELAVEWKDGLPEQTHAQFVALRLHWPSITDVAGDLRTPAVVVMANRVPSRVATVADALPGAVVIGNPGLRTGAELGSYFRRTWDELVPAHGLAATIDGVQAPQRPLTNREAEVMRLLALGLTNAEIAAQLTIAPAAAARHVSNTFDKLQAHNRAAAIDTAHRLGLLK